MEAKPGQYLVQHEWRKDRQGAPLVTALAIMAFEKAPPAMHPDEDKYYPNAGWKRIKAESLIKPKAAQEAEAAKEAEANAHESSDDKIERLAGKSKK